MFLLQYITTEQGVLHCNLNNVKVGDDLKCNGDLTDSPLEEAINPADSASISDRNTMD